MKAFIIMEHSYKHLLKRINRWRLETTLYRGWNITFFLAAKLCIPIASALIAANLSAASSGVKFIENNTMFWLGIAITVLSSFDSFFNPGLQKYRAHRKNIELTSLYEKLKVDWSIAVDESQQAKLLNDVSDALVEILSKYAKEAYGNNAL